MTKKQEEEQSKSQIALKWRLGSKPTLDDVERMLDKKIITNEEARQILFSLEEKTTGGSDLESLKQEVELLRELVMTLSRNPQTITVKEIVRDRYVHTPWYKPYEMWCNALPDKGMFTTLNTGGINGGYINHTVLVDGKVDHSSMIGTGADLIE